MRPTRTGRNRGETCEKTFHQRGEEAAHRGALRRALPEGGRRRREKQHVGVSQGFKRTVWAEMLGPNFVRSCCSSWEGLSGRARTRQEAGRGGAGRGALAASRAVQIGRRCSAERSR